MKIFVTILVFLVLLVGCNENVPDLPPFYTLNFTDNINFTTSYDTVKIVLEKKFIPLISKDSIPYTIINSPLLSDSIKLKFFVSYGGYQKEPVVNKEISIKQDSVFIWYSLVNKIELFPLKSNGITKPNTSPRISYIFVDSVEIKKNPNKTIFFKLHNY
jgi:hypothetical protein